ncbi:MAG: DNA alkylation repair protein [Christensenellaceae bacterium]
MNYSDLIAELKANAEEGYAKFHRKLLKTDQVQVLGVRVPTLRKIAFKYDWEAEQALSFPDEYYEVTFVKLAVIARLPYERFVQYAARAVALIDNWATCDSFKAKCIGEHREEYLAYLEEFFLWNTEFSLRYVLVTLLEFYVEKEYLPSVFSYLQRVDTSKGYYTAMAAAWLTAEVLVKYYEEGVAFLKSGALDFKTHNKAIQKALESFRLTKEQKCTVKKLRKVKK